MSVVWWEVPEGNDKSDSNQEEMRRGVVRGMTSIIHFRAGRGVTK